MPTRPSPSLARALPIAFALVLGLGSCAHPGGSQARRGEEARTEVFHSSVKPLFEHRCVRCHGNQLAHGGLNLQDRSATLDPARRFLVPGKPGQSTIYRALTLEAAHPKVMPGDGWGITREQTDAMRAWIEAGAPWPDDRSGRIKRRPLLVERDDFL